MSGRTAAGGCAAGRTPAAQAALSSNHSPRSPPPARSHTHLSRFSARRAFSSFFLALFFLLLVLVPRGALAGTFCCTPAGNLKLDRPPLPWPSPLRRRHHQKPAAAAAATASSPRAPLPLLLSAVCAFFDFLVVAGQGAGRKAASEVQCRAAAAVGGGGCWGASKPQRRLSGVAGHRLLPHFCWVGAMAAACGLCWRSCVRELSAWGICRG